MRVVVSSPIAALLCAIPMLAHANKPLAPNQQLLHDVYKQLIETNTMDTVGSVTKAVDEMASRCRAGGFPERDILVLAPPGHPTKVNLVVRYRRTGSNYATLTRVFADTGVRIAETVAIHQNSGAAPSPLTAAIMTPVTEITHSMFGANVPVVP